MNNRKKFHSLLYYFVKCLGKQGQTKFINTLVRRKYQPEKLDLPFDLNTVENILFILPEEPLEALHQIANIFSIVNHYPEADVVILCEKNVVPFFENIHGTPEIIEYNIEDRYLFSNKFISLNKIMGKKNFDLCCFLERKPDLSLLHLVGQIGVKVRVTYSDIGEFPFFNFRIKSNNRRMYRTEQNNVMAEMLGAQLQSNIKWSVSKDILEQITIMIKEFSIPETAWLGGIDAQFFYYTFGNHWTESLINALISMNSGSWYLYAENINDSSFINWLKARNIPVFSDLFLSRIAALIYKSDLIISGKTVFFELANLLQKPTIGLFEEKELNLYFRSTSCSWGIPYAKKPDDQTIESLKKKVLAYSKYIKK